MVLPSQGFFAELEHLLTAMMGKADVYGKRAPNFLQFKGERAAKLRSDDLSRMTARVEDFLERYPCGLSEKIVERREKNRKRILKHFRASEKDWNSWEWQVRHIIKDLKTLSSLIKLSEEEYRAVKFASLIKIPFGITPYYLSLMDYDCSRKRDNAIRSQVIPPLSYVNAVNELLDQQNELDFMGEHDTSPIEGITRRYPMIAILKPFLTCPQICVYCQRNWEITDVHSKNAALSKSKLDKAIDWIAHTPELKEILVTGGDPLFLKEDHINYILARLSHIKHIERIRIGSRFFVTLPQRITSRLVRMISQYHEPGKREVVFVTHFEHPYEITPEAMDAAQKVRHCGMSLYNQLVYTFFVSRKFEACALRQRLRLIGVEPYYTFNAKGKRETRDYRAPIARLLQEQKEEARLFPGVVRTDEAVFNVPRLGKNQLRATQHHDLISILPDGRRLYEFHPWEKNLSLVNTYHYKDVSIYDYLQRLRQLGEDLSHYKSIWYYY